MPMKRDAEPETYAQKLARLIAEYEALKAISPRPVALQSRLSRLRSRIQHAQTQAKKRPDEEVEYRPVVEPTEEEIAEACAAYQRTWTESERRHHLGQRQSDECSTTGIKVVDILKHNGGRRR
jgi:chromatin segregation and condensation protein Rec8/ScpA/Scc1 (kleisin family)